MPDAIYRGYTGPDNGRTYYYTDDRDALPPDIRGFAVFPWSALDDDIRAGIRHTEACGHRVCWQVGDDYYETA